MYLIANRFLRAGIIILAGWLLLESAREARAQLTSTEEERLQILTDPGAIRKKLEKDKNRPPFEFFRSQVAPFDILPYVKPNHWFTLTFEMRANDDNYDGILQTEAVKLMGMPHEVNFLRDGRLIKEQRARRAVQMMVPDANGVVPKQLEVELIRRGALRPDATWQATLSTLPPHQMLVLILSKESTAKFAAWNRMAATLPGSAERDGGDLEKLRYYRLVLPIEPDSVSLSSHPLTWTTMSHVVWDNYSPDILSVSQQQAMLDWLHWGGQVVLCGGAGQTFSVLRDSFLGPYLPGEVTGETVPLLEDDLRPLSQSYPPPHYASAVDKESEPVPAERRGGVRRGARGYRAPVAIRPGPKRPVYLTVLKAKEGASTIPLGEASPHVLAVESRVGRGRITMLGLNPNEEALLAWSGIDTLIRRVVLRRPEESLGERTGPDGPIPNSPARGRLLSQDLSWYQITSRDLAAVAGDSREKPAPKTKAVAEIKVTDAAPEQAGETDLHQFPAVADWRDSARLPRLSRDLLEEASGITIPSSQFVLRVILAYLLAVVPLNWLVCRFVLNRREWAWIVVPLVALGFAIGVERVAAHDMGYDTAADEIDLLEVHGDYHRAHLTRLVSLYTTGRSSFAVSYPDDPTALALPLDNGRSIRGEDISSSVWQSSPVPALLNFTVQPRSLALFRAEQMLTLGGAIRLQGNGEKRQVVNESGLELRDAVLLESAGQGKTRNRWLGTIKPSTSVEVGSESDQELPRVDSGPGPDPNPFLNVLRTSWGSREEDQGELRLVAWASGTISGQLIEPALDRKRGFTAVLIHLRSGPPPSPDGKRYNLLASGSENAGQVLIDRSEAAPPAAAASSRPSRRSLQPVVRGTRSAR